MNPPPKVIAIDVDDTLVCKKSGRVNADIANWARRKHTEGYNLIIWSSRGEDNARLAAKLAALDDISTTISKPGYVVDDQGWNWIRYTEIVRRFSE